MIGVNCKFGYSESSPVSWTAIPNVTEFEFPTQVADRVDKSVYGTSRLKRNEPGMEEVGDFTLTVIQDLSNAVQRRFRELKALRTNIWWLIEIPTNDAGTTFVGYHLQGRIGNFEPTQGKEDEQLTKYTVIFDSTSIGESTSGASQIS